MVEGQPSTSPGKKPDPVEAFREPEISAASIVETIHEPLLVLTGDLRVKSANPAFLDQFSVHLEETLGRPIYELGNGQWDIPALRTLLEDVLPDSHVFNDFEVRHVFDEIGERVMLVNARRLNHVQLILLGIRDITEQTLVRDALRDSEARHSFLLQLSDVVRPLADPVEIQLAAARLLGEHLGTDRAYYVEVDEPNSEFVVARDWHRPGAPSHARRYPLTDLPMPWLLEGRSWVINDARSDPTIPDNQRDSYRENDMTAAVVVPLVKEGRLAGTFVTNQSRPRAWTPKEIALVEATAERTWAAVERARADEARRQSEARHRLIVASALDYAILTTRPDGTIDSWSPGAQAVFGWTPEEAVGQPLDMTFVPEDREAGAPEWERETARREGSAPDVRWHLRKSGERVFIDGVSRLLEGADGGVQGFLKIGQDVTERRETTEALRESEERFRTLVQNIRDYAIFMIDANGVITHWTEGAERVKGYTADEVIGHHVSIFYPPEYAGELQREMAEAAEDGRAEREAWRVCKDGKRIWVNEIATALRDGGGRLVGFTKISRDLTERRRADEALRELNETLERRVEERTAALEEEVRERERSEAARREVLQHLVTAEEDERRRISYELHDDLGQKMTGMLLGLRWARSNPGSPELGDRLRALEQLAAETARDIQSMAVELRPPTLDALGLVAAVQNHLEDWSSRHGIEQDFHTTGLGGVRLPMEIETTLYRVVQEGLTNVLKHADATRVNVILDAKGGMLRAIVEDNGTGFDLETLARPEKAGRLGIRGMRERVAHLGGEMEIESSPGSGTTVYVRIPQFEHTASRSVEAGNA